MKTIEINKDLFEDVLYNPNLVVVQKEFSGHLSRTRGAYVYNVVEDKEPVYAVFCEITHEGVEYWKEEYVQN